MAVLVHKSFKQPRIEVIVATHNVMHGCTRGQRIWELCRTEIRSVKIRRVGESGYVP